MIAKLFVDNLRCWTPFLYRLTKMPASNFKLTIACQRIPPTLWITNEVITNNKQFEPGSSSQELLQTWPIFVHARELEKWKDHFTVHQTSSHLRTPRQGWEVSEIICYRIPIFWNIGIDNSRQKILEKRWCVSRQSKYGDTHGLFIGIHQCNLQVVKYKYNKTLRSCISEGQELQEVLNHRLNLIVSYSKSILFCCCIDLFKGTLPSKKCHNFACFCQEIVALIRPIRPKIINVI